MATGEVAVVAGAVVAGTVVGAVPAVGVSVGAGVGAGVAAEHAATAAAVAPRPVATRNVRLLIPMGPDLPVKRHPSHAGGRARGGRGWSVGFGQDTLTAVSSTTNDVWSLVP